jgi:hypothetical protein
LKYLDTDSSGSHPECVSTTIGAERVQNFTAWCRQHGFKALLGEFAGGSKPGTNPKKGEKTSIHMNEGLKPCMLARRQPDMSDRCHWPADLPEQKCRRVVGLELVSLLDGWSA